jgi:hypothetical protein
MLARGQSAGRLERETKKERDPFERELIALLFIGRSGE